MTFHENLRLLEKTEVLKMLARQPYASLAEIGAENGLHQTTVSNLLQKHGISVTGKYTSKEERQAIINKELEEVEKIRASEVAYLKDQIHSLKLMNDTLNERLRYETSRKWYHKLFGI